MPAAGLLGIALLASTQLLLGRSVAAVAAEDVGSAEPAESAGRDVAGFVEQRRQLESCDPNNCDEGTTALYSLWYCWDDPCENPWKQADDDCFCGYNWCDTLYDRLGEGTGFPEIAKVMFWSENPNMKVEFYQDDYCTGTAYASYMVGTGGGDGDEWFGLSDDPNNLPVIKSVRVYNVNDFSDVDGVGVKLIFFPWSGMQPYSEFPCQAWKGEATVECDDSNNECNQLYGNRSPTTNGPDGDCVSSDDLIYALPYNTQDYAMLDVTSILDFASQFCGSSWPDTSTCETQCDYPYMCTFKDYPIGSIYYNLWYSTAKGESYPLMNGFCENGNLQYIRDMCLYTRIWRSEDYPIGENVDWETSFPFVQTVTPIGDLCNSGGYMHSICTKGDEPFGSGAPMWWINSVNEGWVYGDDGTGTGDEPMPCGDGTDLWPLWTSYIAQKIDNCPNTASHSNEQSDGDMDNSEFKGDVDESEPEGVLSADSGNEPEGSSTSGANAARTAWMFALILCPWL